MSAASDPDGAATQLAQHECWALLRKEAYGRLAVVDDDGPMLFPINVVVDRGSLVFRTAEGAKLASIRRDDRVAFEIDGFDETSGEAWSVIIRGQAEVVRQTPEAVEAVDLGVTAFQGGPKQAFVRIVPESVTGRRFSRADQDAWQVPDPDAEATESEGSG